MFPHATLSQWILGFTLILSSIGVISFNKPIYASLSFLLSLIVLASFYLQLSAEFIAVMQVLVYAGAILVIFVFVIVLFQDAHQEIMRTKPRSKTKFLASAGLVFALTMGIFATQIFPLTSSTVNPPIDFGTVHGIGKALYLDFFFPFEAVILLFLVAIIGALYVAKKER